ncbi:haloacid dehalogenase [Mesobacillus campisalis]|uniref:Haloacid dehalogenase n=1 Tax=Mesobacillus campisalis TaxID=1408103 RepID=A0A0M2SMV5_9BACI|nr:Cof-type HAD-IIB family hydrolase [Mesobacillus campisalis]KKK36004.1 haloacid dehalogenase [Mesobacillus campisalis]
MIYRLLALNVDGTVIQDNGRIHKSTKEAIAYVQQKGVYVTLLTSRSFPSARKVAKALKINNAMLVTHQGAYIAQQLGKPVMAKLIPEDVTYEIIRFLEGFPCQIRIVHDEYSLANKYKLNHNLLAKTVFTTGDPMFYSQQFVDSISDTLKDDPATAPKIEVYFEYEDDLTDAREALVSMFSEINMTQLNDLRLDILPQGVSKLNGMISLGEQLGIALKEMVVIGDGQDDIEILKACGLGVAMGNASPEVKRASDWVTRSNNQNGVAYMVKEHFRKQHPISFLRKMNILKK